MCLKCNTVVIFSFNAIEDDVDFTEACGVTSRNKLKTSNLIYNPFDSNEPDYIIGSEYDPDINFYCEKNLFSGFCCKYYSENTFNDKMCSFLLNNTQSFSMCHINLRSINANLSAFECYLDMLQMDFSVIAIIETCFIKNVVAVAAYSRLASRSQAKFHTKKLSPLVRPCAAAPAQSTTSAYRSLRFSPR